MGLVGESGCGKSVTAFSMLQIVGKPGEVVGGQILLHRPQPRGRGGAAQTKSSILPAPRTRAVSDMRSIRGGDIAMIFQEPMTSLSMMHTIGFQIIEAITLHQKVTAATARRQAIAMLDRVGIAKRRAARRRLSI